MRKKSVSVVVPFKDEQVRRNICFCIKSLLSQTVLPYEIIVIGPLKDMNSLVIKHKLVGYLHFVGDKNEARNLGIKKAKGDYILYLDHDMVADPSLIEECLKLARKYNAVIIPEIGAGGSFWENCKRLEKELIVYDIHTVTPRFYRRSLFNKREKPFEKRFGLLDEWGFNHKLLTKCVSVGYSTSYVTVFEQGFTLWKEVRGKFERGLWMKNFYKVDKAEAWRRINPVQRGIIFYGTRLHYFLKEPLYFSGLIIIKTIDFLAFMAGYLVGELYEQ